jgi:hypothetical protein
MMRIERRCAAACSKAINAIRDKLPAFAGPGAA